ncbi:MAG TPA: hypothetical protein PKN54_03315 [Candidatus Cloacimonas acidaminovorans]|nr:hypothetical protein [Candidatus Cloacimonas acidaminovorans]
MIKLEKHFQSKFTQWMEKEKLPCMYELKISHGNTVNFKCFQDQQLPSLYQAYTVGKHFKLTDASLGLKPCDGICYHGDAYVGIMFNIPENQNEFYLIHIREVMKLYNAGKKSITKKNCQEFGVIKGFK